MALRLKRIMERLGLVQYDMTQAVRQTGLRGAPALSQAAACAIINHGRFPLRTLRTDFDAQISDWLSAAGATPEELAGWMQLEDGSSPPAGPVIGRYAGIAPSAESDMLPAAENLTPLARRHFGLFRDPFGAELEDADYVFVWPDFRYCREALRSAARHGGFVGIRAESGAGKTTLKEDLIEWISREGLHVNVIEPYVVGMTDTERQGDLLKSTDISAAVVMHLAPLSTVPLTPQRRFQQAHRLLLDARRAGATNLLFMEEAHALPITTLKQLKRWRELKDGLRPLLGIALVGQPELAVKLSGAAVREVAQRCELVDLLPLDEHIRPYIEHRLARVDRKAADLFEDDVYPALRELLRVDQGAGRPGISLCYPLATNNACKRALNRAAEMHLPKVTGELVAALRGGRRRGR